jgi:hypothetical protein
MAFKHQLDRLWQEVDSIAGGDANQESCGLGQKLREGIPGRWCAEHGYACWWRENPTEIAKAVLVLDAVCSGNPCTDGGESPVSLVEEARRVMLERGLELEEGS